MDKNKLVLFDLDGTLIIGGDPIARKSVVVAIKKVFNIEVNIDWVKHEGSTDRKIAVDVLKEKGISSRGVALRLNELAQGRVEYFSKHIIKSDYKKRLISPAVDLVKRLKKEGVFVGLLTGNFKAMAHMKLKLADIDKFFDFGLFGEMAEDRNKLAKLVFKKAKKHFGIRFLPENIFIIGDTTHDIKCGKATGVKIIGVTTGFTSREDLEAAGADLVVGSLSDKKVLNFILKN